jgi:hypothetical protein
MVGSKKNNEARTTTTTEQNVMAKMVSFSDVFTFCGEVVEKM